MMLVSKLSAQKRSGPALGRSLGPEFGSSVGLIFWLAHTASVAFIIDCRPDDLVLHTEAGHQYTKDITLRNH
jgi:hypothetical protein